MSDPFADPFADTAVAPAASPVGASNDARVRRSVLPVSLLIVCFTGATMPWVLFRPFGDERRGFNVTDVPGGMGIIWTLVLLAIPGFALFMAGRRSGLIIMALAGGMLGWMATISGLLLGVVSSLLPSVELAGIDLTKTQVGQGQGVPVTVLTSLILGFIAIQALQRDASNASSIRVPVAPILALTPLVLLAVNHHSEWLELGNESTAVVAAVPGDSLYGSGLLLVGSWIAVGTWIIALVLRQRMVYVFAAAISTIVGGVSVVYSVLVWLGGKTLVWLMPQSVEGWSSLRVAPGLYVTLVSALLLLGVSLATFIPSTTEKSVQVNTAASLGARTARTSDLVGVVILLLFVVYVVVRVVT
jgi:hypothetical protein